MDFNNEIEPILKVNINEEEVQEKIKHIVKTVGGLDESTKVKLLIQAIKCLDLTSLKGGETKQEIQDLCKRAKNPITFDFEGKESIHPAAVCVYPASAKDAIDSLQNTSARNLIEVASVAADFPNGALPLEDRLKEIREVVNYGVDEVDIVVDRRLTLAGKWLELYNELKQMKEACGPKKMKSILVTGVLPGLKEVYITSMVAMLAGSDFIKTSTGKETVNATLPVGIVMCKAINDFRKKFNRQVGFKPAGGIRTADDALQWLTLIDQELGKDWLNSRFFRIGASSVLDSILDALKK